MFFRGSRYEALPEAEIAGPDGRVRRYVGVRIIPAVEPGPTSYRVQDGDRHDLIAYKALGDPESFWRLCDVARVARPADLAVTPGRRLPLPAPAGGFGGGGEP